MDFLTKNPGLQHVAEEIFMNLDHNDVIKSKTVNQYRYRMIVNPTFWLKKCLRNRFLSKECKMEWTKLIQTLKTQIYKEKVTNCLMETHGFCTLSSMKLDETPLDSAYYTKDLKLIEYILKSKLTSSSKINEMIHKSIEDKKWSVLEKLVAFADDPNLPNEKDGRTPIQIAATKGNSRVIEILAPLVKNPNAPFNQGLTPIQEAAEKGYAKIIKILSALVENPNAPDINGFTPIQSATANGHAKVVEILAPLCDNPNHPDPNGFTPIQVAAMKKAKLGKDYPKIIEVLAPLCQNPNAPSGHGWTPIHHAAADGKFEIQSSLG